MMKAGRIERRHENLRRRGHLPARLGGIDVGYDHPFDELIYLPAAE